MLGPEMNTGLDAGPIQKMCGAGSVPGLKFGENLTSLVRTVPRIFLRDRQQGRDQNHLPDFFSTDFGHFILEIGEK